MRQHRPLTVDEICKVSKSAVSGLNFILFYFIFLKVSHAAHKLSLLLQISVYVTNVTSKYDDMIEYQADSFNR